MHKLKTIQIFRGFAALLVVVFHCANSYKQYTGNSFVYGFFDFGYNGVDFFFVLSGFIITYSFLNETVKSKLSVYFRRRIIRVYPIYWIVTILVLPLYFISSFASIGVDYQRDPSYIVQSFFLIPQIYLPLLAVGWTLTHEVKFYLLFGLFLISGKKYFKYLGVIWGVITILFYFRVFISSNIYVNFIFSPYNLEFLLGAFCAYFVARGTSYLPYIVVGSIIFLGFGIAETYMSMPNGKLSVLTYGISSAVLITGLARYDKKVLGITRKDNSKLFALLLLIGDASYSIYLTHTPILNVLGRLLRFANYPVQSYILEIGIILIVVMSGIIFHIFIEKPVLKFSKSILFRSKHKNQHPTVQVNSN